MCAPCTQDPCLWRPAPEQAALFRKDHLQKVLKEGGTEGRRLLSCSPGSGGQWCRRGWETRSWWHLSGLWILAPGVSPWKSESLQENVQKPQLCRVWIVRWFLSLGLRISVAWKKLPVGELGQGPPERAPCAAVVCLFVNLEAQSVSEILVKVHTPAWGGRGREGTQAALHSGCEVVADAPPQQVARVGAPHSPLSRCWITSMSPRY